MAVELIPLAIEPLIEIALAVSEGDRDQRDAQVRRRAQHVAGENSQSAAVRRNARIDGYIHRKIGNTYRIGMGCNLLHIRAR